MLILKMNYLVYGEIVDDHWNVLQDALIDGCSCVDVWDSRWRGELGNTACLLSGSEYNPEQVVTRQVQ